MIRASKPIHRQSSSRPPRSGPPRFSVSWGLTSGLVGGIVLVLVALALRLTWDVSSITELAADWFTGALPGRVLDWLLAQLSVWAKPLMFVSLMAAQALAGGVGGAAYARIAMARPVSPGTEWMRALAFGAAAWLVTLVTIVPLFGGGFFASDVLGSSVTFGLTTLLAFLAYGLVLGYMFAVAGRPADVSESRSRRAFLVRASIVAGAVVLAGYGMKWLFSQAGEKMSASSAHRARGVLSSEVTPNDQFYTVSKNFIDPEVRLSDWVLPIEGLVDRPRIFEYEEIRALPSVERYVTLECISNEIGGDLISNALWKGVPLKVLLDEAQIAPEARDVAFWAWDGYTESISLDKLMRDEVLVVYEMNGQPLPRSHGYPMRLIVPGFFGLKSVKWLSRIEPVDFNFTGYWQGRGWTDVPIVKTMSRIDKPGPSARLPVAPLEIGGIAFAGTRGIQTVEVKTDETDWTPAEQISEPLAASTWVIWRTTLRPETIGRTTLRVRATDGDGNVQTAERTSTIPVGATGRHEIDLAFERA